MNKRIDSPDSEKWDIDMWLGELKIRFSPKVEILSLQAAYELRIEKPKR
jgi:hypothetical protein